MKKIILTLAIAVSGLLAFAREENVNQNVLNAFNKEFSGAKDVKWTTSSAFYKADFVFNDQHITAFYDRQGELIGLSRNLSVVNLPLTLQSRLRSNYSQYWISDLFEMSGNDGTHYYITLEKADTRIVLRSADNLEWNVFKKTSKQ